MVIKTRYGRYRINATHPEVVARRFALLDGEVARLDERDRDLREAERRGRQGRAYRPRIT